MSPAFFNNSYKGTKKVTQWDLEAANATGFSAAADDFMERSIDLNEALIHNKPATFFMRVNSDAMAGAGIHDGDLVVVDRSLHARNGKIIIAAIYGDLIIRRFEKTFNKVRLLPANNQLAPIEVDGSCDSFSIWGVVTYVIHRL